MIPAVKAFAVTLSFVVKDQTMELTPIKDRNQLTKQTRMSCHLPASLFLANGFSSLLNHASQGGFFFQYFSELLHSKTDFGQE
jgi:hypothetical protein